jgi:hypothetical protein
MEYLARATTEVLLRQLVLVHILAGEAAVAPVLPALLGMELQAQLSEHMVVMAETDSHIVLAVALCTMAVVVVVALMGNAETAAPAAAVAAAADILQVAAALQAQVALMVVKLVLQIEQ